MKEDGACNTSVNRKLGGIFTAFWMQEITERECFRDRENIWKEGRRFRIYIVAKAITTQIEKNNYYANFGSYMVRDVYLFYRSRMLYEYTHHM